MKPELCQLLSRVHELYRQALGESTEAREWLIEQGVTSPELVERFQLGFASGDLKKILPKDARIEKGLRELGILTGSGKGEEHLTGCLVIPLSRS
jgi:DNA primase